MLLPIKVIYSCFHKFICVIFVLLCTYAMLFYASLLSLLKQIFEDVLDLFSMFVIICRSYVISFSLLVIMYRNLLNFIFNYV